MQKYKALGVSEIREIRDERYNFRFCACDSEVKEPEESSGCSCSVVVRGRTTYNSIPRTIYPSSCIHTPRYNKCLIARIKAYITQNLLYVKIGIGSKSLTSPLYQSIKNSRLKNTALLSCSQDTKCQNCTPCKNGFIELNYISLFIIASTKSKQPYLSVNLQPEKAEQWSNKPSRNLFFTKGSINDFNTVLKNKEYSLENVKKGHLASSQFDIAAYKEAVVVRHNVYRIKHGVHPLKTNSELERSAQLWAQHLATTANCLIHDPSKRYGENLFYYATNLLPNEMTLALVTVKSFYLEAYDYNYETHQFLDYHRTGHFTQLVWKSTTEMGVGVGVRYFNGHRTNNCQPSFPSTMIYVVIKYDPPGNILTLENYVNNVLPPVE